MKLDVSKIDGYENLSPEEKIKTLENYDIPDPDYTGYVKKDVFDKTASELADKKKQLNEKLTEDEAKAQREAEERAALEQKVQTLETTVKVGEYKSQYLAMGYDEKLAIETAEAMAKGDTDKVFANHKKHLDSVEKRARQDALKNTPAPTGGDPTPQEMTLEKLKAMSIEEQSAFYDSNPELYKQLYGGENNGT